MVTYKTANIPFYEEWLLYQKEDILSSNIREEIKQCWLEAKLFGLNGFDQPRTLILSDEQLNSISDRSKHLIYAVNAKISQTVVQLEKPIKIPICLLNDQGIILQIATDYDKQYSFLSAQEARAGLFTGFPFMGHTALSLTLKTKKAQVMVGAEHYYSRLHKFTTLAVPIFHPINNECIGVLATIINCNIDYQAYHALLITLAMSVEETIRMEYSHANIFKIHEETTNLIDHYISVVSSDGRIVDCNTAMSELLKGQSIIGSLAIDIIARNFEHDVESSPLYRAIYYGEETSNKEIWTKFQGKRYCFLCDTKIIYDPFDPEFYWIIFIFKDITQNKEIELNVLQREKLVSLGTLAAGLAHEIRNPLTTAKGFIQFLSESSPDKEAFMLIQSELNRIAQLVNQFVLLSKPDSPQVKVLQVNEIISEFVSFIQPEALLNGITITTELEDSDLSIMADKNQLTQVFINLTQNAFSAMERNGELLIKCVAVDSNCIEIRFIDNGRGIDEDHLVKILDPFFTTHEEGTGLGLSICYQIMRAHNGDIRVESEVGKGTTVTLCLPSN